MQRLPARFGPWGIPSVGFALAIAAAYIVVSRRVRPKATELLDPASPRSPRSSVIQRAADSHGRTPRTGTARFKLSIALAAFLAVSAVAAGSVMALALPSGPKTASTEPSSSEVKQLTAGQPRAISRTPGEGSLSFALAATQTAVHRPTSTATPTRTPPATSTSTPTATPTPPPPFVWPAVGWISQPMSAKHPGGIDIAVNTGEPVYAVRAGRVGFAGGDPCCSFGYYVVVEHDDGWTSLYGHLSTLAVVAGAGVEQGQLIGLSGDTGEAEGAHLHFELRRGGVAVNPLEYLPPR